MVLALRPKVVFEIGVGGPQVCRTTQWMGKPGVRIEMFEPNPEIFAALEAAYGHIPNVVMHRVALFDRDGDIELRANGDSSFIAEVASPTVVNAPAEYTAAIPRVLVPCRTLAHYDRGDIDLALIDVEGSEWRVVSKMVSRPKVIIVETHGGPTYTTPDLEKLDGWMMQNGYRLRGHDAGDSLYVRGEP